MLKLLTNPPTNLGKEPEVTKESNGFDRATTDKADLRTFSSADGKQKYLRVWHSSASAPAGEASWFEISKAPEKAKDPTREK